MPLTRITTRIRRAPTAVIAQLRRTASKPAIPLSILRTRHARRAVIGRQCRPIGTVHEILCELGISGAIGEIGAGTVIGDGVVDDGVFGGGILEACFLADHLLGGGGGGAV